MYVYVTCFSLVQYTFLLLYEVRCILSSCYIKVAVCIYVYTHTHTHTSWNVNALCLSLCLPRTLSHSNHERLHMVHKVEWPATVAVGSRQTGWWQCLLSQLSYQKPQLMPVSVLIISTVTVKTSTYVSHTKDLNLCL